MTALIGSVLLASLLGSAHCAGMCGPFACLYAGQARGGRAWLPHAGYNAGRLVSYLFLGSGAGAAGAGMNQLGALAGFSRTAAVVAGALMVLWGAATIAAIGGARVPGASAPPGFRRFLAAAVARFQRHPPLARAALLGLLTTLLPCGWLYAFVAAAASTGSGPRGAAVMAVFWLGTLPVMATVGVAAQRGLGPLGRRLPLVTATVLVMLGLLTIAGRFPAPVVPVAGAAAHATH